MPSTPELSIDSSVESVEISMLAKRGSEVTPPSPSPHPPRAQINSQPPRSLLLVQKHLSTNIQVLADVSNLAPTINKSTKGFKPRVLAGQAQDTAVSATTATCAPSPSKKARIASKNRAVTVFADPTGQQPAAKARTGTNSFLAGQTLSSRRKDAFTAARRKLEGIGDPEEQTDRSSGTSSNDDDTQKMVVVLEAGGALDNVE